MTNTTTQEQLHGFEKIAYKRIVGRHKEGEYDAYHYLNEKESRQIARTRKRALAIAAALGALGVLLLYLPYHLWPQLFPNTLVKLPFSEHSISFGLRFNVYGLILVALEIYGLTMLNISTVGRISNACGFPDPKDPDFAFHTEALIAVSLEKKMKRSMSLGIDPYYGLSKAYIIFHLAAGRLKALLTNLAFKFFVKWSLGRFALRIILDYTGLPVYAFWNAYATNKVIQEAQVRIMAPNLIRRLAAHLKKTLGENDDFKDILFHTLQNIAVSKRDFHSNHFLLAKEMIDAFELNESPQPLYGQAYYHKLQNIGLAAKEGFAKLFIFGMIIDGKLSKKEKRVLDELNATGLLSLELSKAQEWEQSFLTGKGLDDFFQRNLVSFKTL